MSELETNGSFDDLCVVAVILTAELLALMGVRLVSITNPNIINWDEFETSFSLFMIISMF